MYVIIDSSTQLVYTGVISGYPSDVDALYDDFERIFRENNVAHKFHWSKLSRKTRSKMKKPLIKALKKAKKVKFNVFQHRKPNNIEKKEWYLRRIPTKVAQRLEGWLEGKGGKIELIVDDDYNVVKGGQGTKNFIEALIRQTSWRLINKDVKIRKEEKIKATIKQTNGNILSIHASVANKESKWIGITDVYLGIYASEKDLFQDLKNVYQIKIK